VLRVLLAPLSLAGVAFGLTLMYKSMRSVMEVGGACASGGPYEVAVPCPENVPGLLLGGLFGGLVCLAVFLGTAAALSPGLVGLAAWAWPALFLSLGWNFADFGFGEGEWGWILCAVLFALMGGLPAIALLGPSALRSWAWPEDPPPRSARPRPPAPPLTPSVRVERHARAREEAARDVVGDLERLAALHRQGALDADEFERAKEALLGGRPA
jgi:hypothetical protein